MSDGDDTTTGDQAEHVQATETVAGGVIVRVTWRFVGDFLDAPAEADSQIPDDQCAVIRLRDKGLVVLTGCSHAGIVNTVRRAEALPRAFVPSGVATTIRLHAGSAWELRSTFRRPLPIPDTPGGAQQIRERTPPTAQGTAARRSAMMVR